MNLREELCECYKEVIKGNKNKCKNCFIVEQAREELLKRVWTVVERRNLMEVKEIINEVMGEGK